MDIPLPLLIAATLIIGFVIGTEYEKVYWEKVTRQRQQGQRPSFGLARLSLPRPDQRRAPRPGPATFTRPMPARTAHLAEPPPARPTAPPEKPKRKLKRDGSGWIE